MSIEFLHADDQEKDRVVGPEDITLAFVDYFDFFSGPNKGVSLLSLQNT
jgi:hypothetical protein